MKSTFKSKKSNSQNKDTNRPIGTFHTALWNDVRTHTIHKYKNRIMQSFQQICMHILLKSAGLGR